MPSLSIQAYTINRHPAPEKVFEWVRNNWHDLNAHSVTEIVSALRAVAVTLDLDLYFSIAATPVRGEYISLELKQITPEYKREYKKALLNLAEQRSQGEVSFTGTFWDEIILNNITSNGILTPLIEQELLAALHADTEYVYSDDGLREHLSANQYYFFEDGSFCPQGRDAER